MNHLRYAGLGPDRQRAALEDIARGIPVLVTVLERLRELSLPDGWLVSGAIYNNVWNHLTGRAPMTGVKDFDLFYFDKSDLGYAAEDAVIKRAEPVFADLPAPAEIRNQARVHLWYEAHFGRTIPPIESSCHAVDGFASKTHCVALRLDERGDLEVYAPYGLDPIFSFRVVPNRINENRETHHAKGERAIDIWPELTIEPW